MRPLKTNTEVYRRTVERLTVFSALNVLRVVPLDGTNRVHFSHIVVRWFIKNNGKTAVIISVNFNLTHNIINSTVSRKPFIQFLQFHGTVYSPKIILTCILILYSLVVTLPTVKVDTRSSPFNTAVFMYIVLLLLLLLLLQ